MRLTVRVVPNAKRERLLEEEGRVKIYLNAPPVEGAANEALIAFLAEHYQVKRNAVRIISGEKSRTKAVEIKGI
ncbi:hypothetical protein A3K48_06495 [candidate division WOR-1 bacterium RIFOXYA12_FULL_52_29]|uniref:UPF0235 protein A3K49_06495 n=1 Tax=candidate division WOR-1 bacterium RIFOXYC12_FULL_54_18 TaxID=1802584 RepID=A0A1F4T7W3_UNCSA|nr:MAG: hypothetical protein A3K44_06495 [candidate division WOR-1 bacterium RIFOXYA2_FULL_51_19]OGC18172.1 MAG: hypothetical protein A3K48_06495 [candidate division WOR-1 bacterium RIFOXYA12_FULL_52_29]OGC27027.1 MAG: hypothetical protein A3K32_06490 [candidate division WOR-1 bacterium RIFOXYB2_FULL_45_9]OGC28589.1 MAG: hypothetical protein A3K49_06495 [candidate division WOR-1 bacterium RIFOXYC12_FULL_54_18]OGC30956.1 MAG: hypothetical protein A2346_06125 [candidate division WOR-1 bacterium R